MSNPWQIANSSIEWLIPKDVLLFTIAHPLEKALSCSTHYLIFFWFHAGVLGCPRTCLHAILNILEKGTEGRTGPLAVKESPQLAELCYQVCRGLDFVAPVSRSLCANPSQICKYHSRTKLKWVHLAVWPVFHLWVKSKKRKLKIL